MDYEKEELIKKDGYEFEKYVADLFPKSKFDIVKGPTRYDDASDEDLETNCQPDLCIKVKNTQFKVWIECKYKSKFVKVGKYDNINWTTKTQFKRYNKFESDIQEPVYIAIGVGGTPHAPSKFYLVPLKDLESETLYKSTYDVYERSTDSIIKVDYTLR